MVWDWRKLPSCLRDCCKMRASFADLRCRSIELQAWIQIYRFLDCCHPLYDVRCNRLGCARCLLPYPCLWPPHPHVRGDPHIAQSICWQPDWTAAGYYEPLTPPAEDMVRSHICHPLGEWLASTIPCISTQSVDKGMATYSLDTV